MSLRLCVLASGSSGNATYVASDNTAILIDAGLSGREITVRLRSIGIDIAGIAGICVTHEHGDHVAALRVLHSRYNIPIFANAGTVEGCISSDPARRAIHWHIFTTGTAFEIGDLSIQPFSVPHDAYDPVGFVISQGTTRIGIVTDMGMATSLVRERLRNCHALILEANHDEDMLRDSRRPWSLKQRIMSRQGHLSNTESARLLREISGPQLEQVFLAHLSQDCNTEKTALSIVQRALESSAHRHIKISLTHRDRVSELWTSPPEPAHLQPCNTAHTQ